MLSLLLFVAIVGFLTWMIVTYVPMPQPFPKIIIMVAAIVVVFRVLAAFGLLSELGL